MNNLVSLRYIHDNESSVWSFLTEHECTIKKFGNTIYKGKMSDGKYFKYISDDDSQSMTLECEVEDGVSMLMTIEHNEYIDKIKGLANSIDDIMASPKLYCEAINMIGYIPMVKGNTWKEKIEYVLEADDKQNSMALGQEGAKKDKNAKARTDVQFKIFSEPDNQVTHIDDGNDKYLKIEYVYNDEKNGIQIDFLIGKKDNTWYLYAGKIGSTSYDDDPYKDLETKDLDKAINKAVSEVIELIDKVKKDKKEYVQFYQYK